MLSERQIRLYDEFGFIIIPKVFYKGYCQIIKDLAEGVATSDYKVYLNIHRKVWFFKNLVKDKELVGMVKQVQRSNVVVTNDQYLYKRAGTPYARQAWSPHQDATYVNAPYGTYMQAFIFLDPHRPDNGGLYFYPGSHKEPMLPYQYVKSWGEDFDEQGISHPGWEVQVPEKYKLANVVAEPGDVCLQHGNLIHGSYANLSEESRAQYSIAYLNEGVTINKGKASVKVPMAVE